MASTRIRVMRPTGWRLEVSLGSHDRYVLNAIGDELADSDPSLAGLIGTFTRLTAGEKMPAREQIRPRWRRVLRSASGRRLRLGPAGGLIMLWLLVTAAMVSVAIALSSGGTAACNNPWTKVCAAPSAAATAHARSS
jgi:hypothetical protein